MGRLLSPEARFLSNLINEAQIKSILLEQVEAIFYKAAHRPPKSAFHTANALVHDGLIVKEDNLLMERSLPYRNDADISCVWYLIYAMNKLENITLDDYMVLSSNRPCSFRFIFDNEIYQVCFCNNANDANILALEKSFKEEKLDIKSALIFPMGVDIDSSLAQIEKLDLKMPHVLAFMKSKLDASDVTFTTDEKGIKTMHFTPASMDFEEYFSF